MSFIASSSHVLADVPSIAAGYLETAVYHFHLIRYISSELDYTHAPVNALDLSYKSRSVRLVSL